MSLRIMCLDVGEKRIGIALSDPLGKTAQPLLTIERNGFVLERLRRIAVDNRVGRIVVGLPLLLDGSEGAQARKVKEFSFELENAVGIPVSFADERLTTRQAEGIIARGEPSNSAADGAVDRIAAALILQAFMDSRPEG